MNYCPQFIDRDAKASEILEQAKAIALLIVEDAFAFVDNKHRRTGGYAEAATRGKAKAIKELNERLGPDSSPTNTETFKSIAMAERFGVVMGFEAFLAMGTLGIVDGRSLVIPYGKYGGNKFGCFSVIVYTPEKDRRKLADMAEKIEQIGLDG